VTRRPKLVTVDGVALVTADDMAAMRPTRAEVERAAAGPPSQTQRIAAAIVSGRPLDLIDLCLPSRLSRRHREWLRTRAEEFLTP
jgi:hypothetical protein